MGHAVMRACGMRGMGSWAHGSWHGLISYEHVATYAWYECRASARMDDEAAAA